jgi:Ni,Fe-hydrogenase III component G
MLNTIISNAQVAIAGRVLDDKTKQIISGAMVEIIEMPEEFQKQLKLKELQYDSQWRKMSVRPDRQVTKNDGYFYFVNLPPGEYTLKASVLNRTIQYVDVEEKSKKVEVTVKESVPIDNPKILQQVVEEKSKKVKVTVKDSVPIDNPKIPKQVIEPVIPAKFIDIILVKATGIKGKIVDNDKPNSSVSDAEVKIKGSNDKTFSDRTFSDRNGNYWLVGLEPFKSKSKQFTVIVSAKGYRKDREFLIEIAKEKVITKNFPLEKQTNNN